MSTSASKPVTAPARDEPPTDAARPSGSRNLALDGARGLAIVLVLVCHAVNYPAPATAAVANLQRLSTFTFGGVELFFVLSGFLIGTGLLRTRHALNQFSVFYARRACRILPVYALLLASFFLIRTNPTLITASEGAYFRGAVPLWSYFVFLQNIFIGAVRQAGPWWLIITWSLAIEEQFYAVAPWVIRRANPGFLLGLALAFVVICPVVRHVLLVDIANPAAAIYLTLSRIDSLFVGVAIAAIWETPAWRARAIAWRRPLGWSMVGFGVLFWAGPFSALGESENVIVWMPTLLGLGFAALLLWILAEPANVIARVLSTRFWVFMGGISYFVYLFHLPAFYVSHGLLRHATPAYFDWLGIVATLLALAAVVLVAVTSRRWLEQPMINFGHRFHHRFP